MSINDPNALTPRTVVGAATPPEVTVPIDCTIRTITVENPNDEAAKVEIHYDLDGTPVGSVANVFEVSAGSGVTNRAGVAAGHPLQKIGSGKIVFTCTDPDAKMTAVFSPAKTGV